MPKKTYIVQRPHVGDRDYVVGEDRTADEADVAHLVPHVLKEKAEAKAENKAEPKLRNKAKK